MLLGYLRSDVQEGFLDVWKFDDGNQVIDLPTVKMHL